MEKHQIVSTFYHVIRSKIDDSWHVKTADHADIKMFSTKEAAIQYATSLAQQISKNNVHGHVIVEREDGTFETIRNF